MPSYMHSGMSWSKRILLAPGAFKTDNLAQTGTAVCCSDEQLVQQAQQWSILGKDLVSQVTCSEPYEWQGSTEANWEFSEAVRSSNGSEPLHVSVKSTAYCFEMKYGIMQVRLSQANAPYCGLDESPCVAIHAEHS